MTASDWKGKPPMRELAVVGAGMAGLAAAHRLEELAPNARVTVYEAADRVGGVIRSEPAPPGSVVLEGGPDSLLARKPAGVALVEAVGLADDLVTSHPAARGALLYVDGALMPLPPGVVAGVPLQPERLQDSPLLTAAGREALMADLGASPETISEDVSLGAFLARRLGHEWTDRVASSLLSGIYAGHMRDMSLLATYPELAAAAQHGSLIRGLAAERAAQPPRPGPVFVTLAGGLESLPRRVAERLRTPVRTGEAVTTVAAEGPRYRLSGEHGEYVVDGLVLATPAPVAARQLARLAPAAAERLARVPYTQLAVVTLRYAPGVAVPAGMTGVLVPAGAGLPLTAITFVGQKWAHRVPPADVPVRVFYGRAAAGPAAPDVLAWSDERFQQQAASDLCQVLGWAANPLSVRVHRHPVAMPQYLVGHPVRVAEVEAELARRPGLALAGASLHGVGIPDVIRGGRAAAERVMRSLEEWR